MVIFTPLNLLHFFHSGKFSIKRKKFQKEQKKLKFFNCFFFSDRKIILIGLNYFSTENFPEWKRALTREFCLLFV